MPNNNNEHLTLAGASIIIADYLNAGHLIPPHEKEFLQSFQNRIRAITTAQCGWLKVGPLANAKSLNQSITQEDLINEARLAQQNTIGFTWITVNKLITDIQAETNNAHTHSFTNLLSDIQKCCECILDNIKPNISFKESKESTQISSVKLLESENIFYSSNVAVQMIQLLNGRILPFSQGDDPLRGKENRYGRDEQSSGYCHGYVKSWCKEIAKHGHASDLARVDNEVHDFQQNPSNPIIPTWMSDYFLQKQILEFY